MTIIFFILAVVSLGLFVAAFLKSKRLEKLLADKDGQIAAATQEAERARQHYESETARVFNESQASLTNAQQLVEQQLESLKQESERVRQHYEAEARRILSEAEAKLSQTLKELEPLRRFEGLRDAGTEIQRVLTEAMNEATALRQEAQTLLEQSRTAAADERSQAKEKAKEIRQQADALLNQVRQQTGAFLNQARRDAERIVDDANKQAELVAGEAYMALQDKQLLERAATAMRNVVEGYGDRYIFPTRSLLDELAADFGHTAAGEALRAAREQSRQMVEQGRAATCDYVEDNRRETAIRFVIDAFNGRVDSILADVSHDNSGTLEQKIRDSYGLVNLHGAAFRNARILPAYLDARLAELKWATVVRELELKEHEEQQRIRMQMREEEKVRREIERTMRESAKEQEVLRQAMEKAQQQVQLATTEQKAKYEQQLQELAEKLKEAEEKNQRAISMAQQTKLGHVYIISNVGSFGENVYKIGLTRRLVPQDRIDELGDSSVPFDFDVHAMIHSEDAPKLESQLHNHFVMMQLNKVNHRKEFFRVDLNHIRTEIEKLGLNTQWTMAAQAAEYRQSLAVERAIKDNPSARKAWIERQLELEHLETQPVEIEEVPTQQ